MPFLDLAQLFFPFLSLLILFLRVSAATPPPPQPSLEESVGQLFLVGVSGKELSLEQQAELSNQPFGNFLLFRDNIGTDEQVQQLTASLSATNRWPTWVAIDQEGGSVVRVTSDPAAEIGQPSLVDPQQAYEVARVRGKHLRSLGISLPLSPVVDHAASTRAGLADRTFPHHWGELGDAMVRGYLASQTTPVVKHFPSYGDIPGDVEASIPHKQLSAEEIAIFRESLQRAPVLMISPIIIDNIDPELPAPLSPRVIRFIRQELKFDGVILTDDVQMRAVRKEYSPSEFALKSLEAGVDMVMFSGDWAEAKTAYEEVVRLSQEDDHWRERVNRSFQRIRLSK